MNVNIFKSILKGMASSLPSAVQALSTIQTDIAGHDKKAAIEDGLDATASGVSVVAPEFAFEAQAAAMVAKLSIEGVYAILVGIGKINPHPVVVTSAVEPVNTGSLVQPAA